MSVSGPSAATVAGAGTPASAVRFGAVLRPHRSLGPLGFRLLMAAVAGGAFAIGTAFWLAGAWPVVGFLGLEVLLVYGAFRLSYRSGRLYETVTLTDADLTVERVAPSGRIQRWRFPPNWLAVRLADPPDWDTPLTLASHGRELVIGAFLTPPERKELAEAIRAALDAWRRPPVPEPEAAG